MIEIDATQTKSGYFRRCFTDGKHFDITIWYQSAQLGEILGFQLGYKENPFDTDHEFIINSRPQDNGKIEFAKVHETKEIFPASKLIQKTKQKAPPSFKGAFNKIIIELPEEISVYLKNKITSYLPD